MQSPSADCAFMAEIAMSKAANAWIGTASPSRISIAFRTSAAACRLIQSFILTRLIKEINEKKILCNKQIGFIRGCGTELNLLKLRQKVFDIKKEKNFYTKYLVFIDLKNA